METEVEETELLVEELDLIIEEFEDLFLDDEVVEGGGCGGNCVTWDP